MNPITQYINNFYNTHQIPSKNASNIEKLINLNVKSVNTEFILYHQQCNSIASNIFKNLEII